MDFFCGCVCVSVWMYVTRKTATSIKCYENRKSNEWAGYLETQKSLPTKVLSDAFEMICV